MKRVRRAAAAIVFFVCAIGVSAQQRPESQQQPPPLPPGSKTGNPTPGTPQPDPPNLADRITVVGCVQTAANKAAPGLPRAESRGPSNDPNTPSDARFVLARAERKSIVPPGTGTSSVAASVTSSTFRLFGIDSQLSPFVGTRVELSGEVQLSAMPSSTDGSAAPPVVHVQFVQKIAASCS